MIGNDTHPWTRWACDADAQNWRPGPDVAHIELSDLTMAVIDGGMARELRRDLVIDSRGRVFLRPS